MPQHYSDPSRESDPHALPNVETYYSDGINESGGSGDDTPADHAGWYWQACSPGCLPDSDPVGPFDSEAEALADAREGFESPDLGDDCSCAPNDYGCDAPNCLGDHYDIDDD